MSSPEVSQNPDKLPAKTFALIASMLGIWLLLYGDAIQSAIRIWYVSEVFSHGFFIIPGALYLVWRERRQLDPGKIEPNYATLLLIFPLLFTGLFAYVGDIQVLQHLSAFTVLPVIIWGIIGNRLALQLWFPLLFILFSIPVGEELVPTLQRYTADLSVWMLGLTSLPVYNTGLYIEIPQGRFVVAEACSGIRFFIGSIVFGALFSHLTFQRFSFKLGFVLLSVVVPVLANALRVFGIVLAGYFSDMKVAAGADHIIYGWVFFAIVLFLLIVTGEFIKKFEPPLPAPSKSEETGKADWKALNHSLTAFIAVFLVFVFWKYSFIDTQAPALSSALEHAWLEEHSTAAGGADWQPVFDGQSDAYTGRLKGQVAPVDIALYWYAGDADGQELVASRNRLFDVEEWSHEGSFSHQSDEGETLKVLDVVGVRGQKRLISYFYMIDGQVLTSAVKSKLLQTWDKTFGGTGAGAIVIWSVPYQVQNRDERLSQLLDQSAHLKALLMRALPGELDET